MSGAESGAEFGKGKLPLVDITLQRNGIAVSGRFLGWHGVSGVSTDFTNQGYLFGLGYLGLRDHETEHLWHARNLGCFPSWYLGGVAMLEGATQDNRSSLH